MKNLSKTLSLLILVLTPFVLNGCVSVPFISAYKDLGATPGDRQVLLTKELKEFNLDRHWGKTGQVLSRVKPEAHDEMRDELLRAKRSKERIVESNVEIIDFDEESYNATVNMAVRYFGVPSYVVQERYEKQQWVFEMGTGWKLQALIKDAEPYATS